MAFLSNRKLNLTCFSIVGLPIITTKNWKILKSAPKIIIYLTNFGIWFCCSYYCINYNLSVAHQYNFQLNLYTFVKSVMILSSIIVSFLSIYESITSGNEQEQILKNLSEISKLLKIYFSLEIDEKSLNKNCFFSIMTATFWVYFLSSIVAYYYLDGAGFYLINIIFMITWISLNFPRVFHTFKSVIFTNLINCHMRDTFKLLDKPLNHPQIVIINKIVQLLWDSKRLSEKCFKLLYPFLYMIVIIGSINSGHTFFVSFRLKLINLIAALDIIVLFYFLFFCTNCYQNCLDSVSMDANI